MRKDGFDEREADFYEALYTQSQAQFGAYVSAGTVVNNYAHIFDLLIRLRQVTIPRPFVGFVFWGYPRVWHCCCCMEMHALSSAGSSIGI